MESTTSKSGTSTTQETWKVQEPKESLYSGDAIIDAYLKGKREGLKAAEKASLDLLSANINKSGGYTGKVINELIGKKFIPLSAHLKICSITGLNVIIVVREQDFLSEEFLDIYSFIGNYENAINEDLFNISFSFIDGDKKFNISRLNADGFHLTYKMPLGTESTRKA